jgi:hypothetical protein
MTAKEIIALLELLDDAKNLTRLIATAGDAIDNGCVDDREGTRRLLDIGVSIRVASEIVIAKVEEAAALLDKTAAMPMPEQSWHKW